MCVIDRPETPSRHCAILAELNSSIPTLEIQPRRFIPKVAWYKATPDQKSAYSANLSLLLDNVFINQDSSGCMNLSCTSAAHRTAIDEFCSQIIHACLAAEQQCIPQSRPPKQHAVAGWKEVVEPLRQTAIFWHNIWVDCDRPNHGAVADVRRKTRKDYHNSVKDCMKNQKSLKRQRLGELASAATGSSRPLFVELKRLAGSNRCCSNRIDGLDSDLQISNKFAEKYADTYNMLETEDISEINETIESRIEFSDSDCCTINEREITVAVAKLKPDKHDGNGFYSNLLLQNNAHLNAKLAQLFSCMLTHGHTPSALLSANIVPIPKDIKGDLCNSDNYRGISLGSAISKLFDVVTLDRYGVEYLNTSDMQFAYKHDHSTTMCTTVMKEIVQHYWHGKSSVYACFVDATKAFDLVSFPKLFSLLLDRGLPIPFLRIILDTYKRQNVSVTWNSMKSNNFNVKNGVRQGAILSAVLFTVYIDELLLRLQQQQLGCHIDGLYAGALAYADDVTLLCPTLDGLKKMIVTLEQFGLEFKMRFNPTKTKCMKFALNHKKSADIPPVIITGRQIEWVDSFRHLGAHVTYDLSDTVDIEQKRNHFIRQANYVIHSFSACPSWLKSKLIQTYATALYGSQAWQLDNRALDRIRTAWNIVQRKVWRLPWRAHSVLLPLLAQTPNLMQQVKKRTANFIKKMEVSSNILVATVTKISYQCHSSVVQTNKGVLREGTQTEPHSDEAMRTTAQIRELNQCLDDEMRCGLSSLEMKQILNYISTCDL